MVNDFAVGAGDREPLELRLLHALAEGDNDLTELCAGVGEPRVLVASKLAWAVDQGLVQRLHLAGGSHYALTPAGLDLVTVQQRVDQLNETVTPREAEAQVRVSDAERDAVVTALQEHYAAGRITIDELGLRTEAALSAHTRGDLDAALAQLVAPAPPVASPVPTQPVQRRAWPFVVLVIAIVFASPFVLFGFVFALAGDDLGDRVFGIVLLVASVPGLVALGRWALRSAVSIASPEP